MTQFLLLVGLTAAVWAQQPTQERLVRQPVRGSRGAVAGGSDYATNAGMRMFEQGGNAVDAGVASVFAAAVTEYSHFGFGGEAPILIRTRDGKVVSIAGVGTMPRLATAELFRKRPLQPGEVYMIEPFGLRHMVPTAGIMPVLVPGMVDAALLALREYGTLSLGQILKPAIEYAESTVVDEERAMNLRATREILALYPSTAKVFLTGGRTPRAGEIVRQPDLARTMTQLVEAETKAKSKGRSAAIDAARDLFYRGEIARRIATFVEQQGGLLRYEDMAAFRLQPEEPLSIEYHGCTIYKPGFWSQGPALLQTLAMLDGLNVPASGLNSANYIHTLTEALKLSYADRDTYYGDPAVVKVPSARLLSLDYAAQRRELIGPKASLDFRPGAMEGFPSIHPSTGGTSEPPANMTKDTTSVVAMDKDGVVFSSTPSGAWLPFVIAGDTGIPLTQRAQSFLLFAGHPNELAGGKRPRVTLSPTLVTREGRPMLALATPGGDNQEQSQLQVLLNVIDFQQNAQRAVETPRFQTRHLVSSFDNHGMLRGDLVLDERISSLAGRDLQNRGHRVESRPKHGSEAAPVLIRMLPSGALEAGADPFAYRSARAW